MMKFIAKTLYGLENVLARELSGLGAEEVRIANRAVLFSGGPEMMYAANYMLRTAVSVLWQISEFRINSADDLYARSLKINWDRFMDVEDTFSVVPVVQSRFFNHTGFAALKLKDSIADYFRNKSGKRPSVDSSSPAITINLHISNDRVTISLDSSHAPLFQRGYRKESSEAPLNEVLAAGMIMLSGWDSSTDLIDPMCGSGTILIEAAMIACRIPPGKFRRSFGFQRWKSYDRALFESVKSGYDSIVTDHPGIKITGFDISPMAVRGAELNVRNAGLASVIHIEEKDFRDLRPGAGEGGYVFINPPYGERLSAGETDILYGMIGSTLKHNFHGYEAWIISSNRESLKYIGLKPSMKHILFNGALECLFTKYELYEGTRKAAKV